MQAGRLVVQQPSRAPAVGRAGWVVAQSLDPQEAHGMLVLVLVLLLLLVLVLMDIDAMLPSAPLPLP